MISVIRIRNIDIRSNLVINLYQPLNTLYDNKVITIAWEVEFASSAGVQRKHCCNGLKARNSTSGRPPAISRLLSELKTKVCWC